MHFCISAGCNFLVLWPRICFDLPTWKLLSGVQAVASSGPTPIPPQPDQMSHTSPGSDLFFPLAQREGTEFLISQILCTRALPGSPVGAKLDASPNFTAPPDKVQVDFGITAGLSNSRA